MTKIDIEKLSPSLRRQQNMSRIRNNRKYVVFNEMELAAIEDYCRKYNITSMSSFFREVIMEKVFSQIDDAHPRLF